jgi:putative flippase GtrA
MAPSRGLAEQARRFAASGVLATGLHALVAASFVNLVAPIPTLANGIAFTVATAFSYLMNTLWSFRKPPRGRNLIRYVLVASIGCFLAVGISGMAEHYGASYVVGILAVVCIVPPFTFALHGFWTYRD